MDGLDTGPSGILRRRGEGELLSVAGVEHFFRLTAEDTDGAFAFEEFELAPGVVGARPHVHAGHDEYFYVLDGELTLTTRSGDLVAQSGSIFAATRGTPHGFRNDSTAVVRGLCLYTPAGYENYFREVHAAVAGGATVTEDLLTRFRSRHRTTAYDGQPR
ncbi:MAG: cupin domain-containing protein [Nocardioides sp.]